MHNLQDALLIIRLYPTNKMVDKTTKLSDQLELGTNKYQIRQGSQNRILPNKQLTKNKALSFFHMKCFEPTH